MPSKCCGPEGSGRRTALHRIHPSTPSAEGFRAHGQQDPVRQQLPPGPHSRDAARRAGPRPAQRGHRDHGLGGRRRRAHRLRRVGADRQAGQEGRRGGGPQGPGEGRADLGREDAGPQPRRHPGEVPDEPAGRRRPQPALDELQRRRLQEPGPRGQRRPLAGARRGLGDVQREGRQGRPRRARRDRGQDPVHADEPGQGAGRHDRAERLGQAADGGQGGRPRVAQFFTKYVQGPQTPEPGAACTSGLAEK